MTILLTLGFWVFVFLVEGFGVFYHRDEKGLQERKSRKRVEEWTWLVWNTHTREIELLNELKDLLGREDVRIWDYLTNYWFVGKRTQTQVSD